MHKTAIIIFNVFLKRLKNWEIRERKKARDYSKEAEREDERRREMVCTLFHGIQDQVSVIVLSDMTETFWVNVDKLTVTTRLNTDERSQKAKRISWRLWRWQRRPEVLQVTVFIMHT